MNRFAVCFVSSLVLAVSAHADPIQLIVNGGTLSPEPSTFLLFLPAFGAFAA